MQLSNPERSMLLFIDEIQEEPRAVGLLRYSLHSFVNLLDARVTAVRVWSGEFGVQDVATPAPDDKPYRLINVPFYYVGQLDKILKENML